jgi:hypothetical protein
MPFKQFITNHKIASITAIVIATAVIMPLIVFFRNTPTNQTQENRLQLNSSQSSVISSSSSNLSSMSSSSVTISSSSQSVSSSVFNNIDSNSLMPQETKTVENNTKPKTNAIIPAQITNSLPIITENKIKDSSSTEIKEAKEDFSKIDIDGLITYYRKLVDLDIIQDEARMKALEGNSEFDKWKNTTEIITRNSAEFKEQNPEGFSKYELFWNEIWGVLGKKFAAKWEVEAKISEQESKRLIQICKQNISGYEYISLDVYGFNNNYSVFESKVKVYDKTKQGVERVIEDIKLKCVDGTFKFFDANTVDYNLSFYPRYIIDESGKNYIEDKYNHFLAESIIRNKQTVYFDYYPDYIIQTSTSSASN